MRTRTAALLAVAALGLAAPGRGQAPPPGYSQPGYPHPEVAPPPEPTTIAGKLEVYAFPSQGQPPEQQSRDEAECYAWAVRTTGYDAFAVLEQAEQQSAAMQQRAAATQRNAEAARAQASQVGAGAGAHGAVAGAATGALIGSWGANAGEGAAIGAVVGLLAGRARAENAQSQAEAQVEARTNAQMQQQARQSQQAQQVFDARMDGFRKAFSVCLEAKHYLVRL